MGEQRCPWALRAVGGCQQEVLNFLVADAGDEVLRFSEELLETIAEVFSFLSGERGREGWGEGGGGGGGGHGGGDGG